MGAFIRMRRLPLAVANDRGYGGRRQRANGNAGQYSRGRLRHGGSYRGEHSVDNFRLPARQWESAQRAVGRHRRNLLAADDEASAAAGSNGWCSSHSPGADSSIAANAVDVAVQIVDVRADDAHRPLDVSRTVAAAAGTVDVAGDRHAGAA